MVPVQAYIPYSLWRNFRKQYRKHGAISHVIRQAFEAAIMETSVTEEAAQYAKALYLPEEGTCTHNIKKPVKGRRIDDGGLYARFQCLQCGKYLTKDLEPLDIPANRD